MCRFLSGIGLRNGDLKISDVTDSHSEILSQFNIPDDKHPADHVTLECHPGDDCRPQSYLKPEKYKIHCDGDRPEWVTDRMLRTWQGRFRLYLKDCLVTTDKSALMGGRWVIGNGVIRRLRLCYIPVVIGGTLGNFHDGTLRDFHGGTLGDFRGGTLRDFHGGTLGDF